MNRETLIGLVLLGAGLGLVILAVVYFATLA